MEPAAPPTIIDLKYAFLRTQVQALSQPHTVPPSFRTQRANASDRAADQLRQKSIDEAMLKLNSLVKQHSKQVYSRLAQRHVAEQIDSLYWDAGQRAVDGDAGGEGDVLDQDADLTAEHNIERLPNEWPGEEEDEQERQEYVAATDRLRKLDERRRALRERVQRYRALKEALEPFEKPKENVQENLCVKNGPLENELDRMRMLIARVQGRVAGLDPAVKVNGADEDVLMVDQGGKLEKLLALD